MTLSTPQIILLGLMFLTSVYHISRDGRPKPIQNFYVTGMFWLFEVFVLATTPFFDRVGIPQVLWGAFSLLGLFSSLFAHGRKLESTYNGPLSVIASAVILGIYYFGGFFN